MICGATFERLSTGEMVACVLPEGHACAHHWEKALKQGQKDIMVSSAARNRRKARARKEGAVTPVTHETKLPAGWTLEPRSACQPRGADERPVLRRDGRVQAVVDVWTPEDMGGRETLS